uniref:Disintegrin and metalloproteinase domain-containing protein 10-like n=1 Tax=Seriola dumerili TaxID=41447 RepID=A0A3B4U629_SERDU
MDWHRSLYRLSLTLSSIYSRFFFSPLFLCISLFSPGFPLLCLLCPFLSGAVGDISPYIKHYEGLSYDREDLHKMHLRARRATQPQEHTLQLDFTAFHRTFRLRLRRNAAAFSQTFMVVSENGSTSADLSHIYSGILEGEHGSACHGSVLQGQFEGTIHTDNGTYHIESVHRYNSSQTDHHSIIYHEDDMSKTSFIFPLHEKKKGFLKVTVSTYVLIQIPSSCPCNFHPQEAAASRTRRTVDESKTSCLLHLHVDHLYFKRFKSVEAVVAQVINTLTKQDISNSNQDFIFNFRIDEDKNDPLNPLFIGPETLLSLYSEKNWGNFCLSYLLTNRDYSGVLGLAWEGKTGNWGGICSKQTTLRNGQTATLNTGLVTIQNFGQFLPTRLVQLTFAHELGHSLGSPHDEGSNCGNLGSSGGKGRYLMFPHATDEVRENNEKFSHCSIKHISKMLKLKKDDCFVVSNQPICGNQIVEKDEECDVGHNDTDPCCYSAKEPVGVQCRLKPGKVCSPSQGLCCSHDCGFKPASQTCDEETDCQRESVCSGLSPLCPEPSAKENFTVCSQGTRVCLNGVCAESVCVKHRLQQCDCPGDSMKEKCHMCCQQLGNHEPVCAPIPRNVFTLCGPTKQPGSICTEVTHIHYCFPLDNVISTTRDAV